MDESSQAARQEDVTCVYIRKLPKRAHGLQRQLESVLAKHGAVKQVVVMHGRGHAIVRMETADAVQAVLASCKAEGGLRCEHWPRAAEISLGNKRESGVELGWDLNDDNVVQREVCTRPACLW